MTPTKSDARLCHQPGVSNPTPHRKATPMASLTRPSEQARINALHHLADRMRAGMLADPTLRVLLPALVHPGLAPAAARVHLRLLGLALGGRDRVEIDRHTAALMTGVDPAHTTAAAPVARVAVAG